MRRARMWMLVMTALLSVSVASAGVIQYEIQNQSKQDANDAHLVFSHKVTDAKNGAFTDPPQGIGSNTLDWPKSGGSGTVPAGYKWWFKTKEPDVTHGTHTSCTAGLIPESSYFTHNGAKIDNSVKWTDASHLVTWEKDPAEGIYKCSVSLVNDSDQWMHVSNLVLYDNVDRIHYTLDEFNAGHGTLVPGIAGDFWMENGTVTTFDLGLRSDDIFVHLRGQFAFEGEDPFEFQMASAPPIPEPMTAILVATATVPLALIRRRRRRRSQ